MDSVIRVFNDRRPYVRPKIQNPQIQLLSGKHVNLSQWCPAKFDFEAETYTANRMLRAWRRAHPSERATMAELYIATLGDASPYRWTMPDLDALAIKEKRRNFKVVKRAGLGVVLSLGLFVALSPRLNSFGRIALVLAGLVCMIAMLVFGALLLIERQLDSAPLNTLYGAPKSRSGRRRTRPPHRG
jgi:hypothetical protein